MDPPGCDPLNDAQKDDRNENHRNHNAQNDDVLNDDAPSDDLQNIGSRYNSPRNDGVQNSYTPTVTGPLVAPRVLPQRGRNAPLSLEYCFISAYDVLTSVMSKLDRLDFKNLRLAGLRTPISQEIQRAYLISSKCDEVMVIPGHDPITCPHTTQHLDEIRTCHGRHRDGTDLKGVQEKWVEPAYLFKHVQGTDLFVQSSNENIGGHFDSFNVCIYCYDRGRWYRRLFVYLTFGASFYSRLCSWHSLEYGNQRPYNACRCKGFLEKYWRCDACSRDTLEGLRVRAQRFRDAFEKVAQPDGQITWVCPISGCTRRPWDSGPSQLRMELCRACTGIFPEFR